MQMTCLIYWLMVIDLQYINSLIKFIKLFQLPSWNSIIYCEYELHCLQRVLGKGTKVLKSCNLRKKKKGKRCMYFLISEKKCLASNH